MWGTEWQNNRTPYTLRNFEDRLGLRASLIFLDSNMRGFLFISTMARSETLVVNWQNCSYYSTRADLYSHQMILNHVALNVSSSDTNGQPSGVSCMNTSICRGSKHCTMPPASRPLIIHLAGVAPVCALVRLCANLRVQEQSTNMTSQCHYPTFA